MDHDEANMRPPFPTTTRNLTGRSFFLCCACLSSVLSVATAFVVNANLSQPSQTRSSMSITMPIMPSQPSITPFVLRRSTARSMTDGSSESTPDDNDSLVDLYRTVAEQDPEWFEEFVVNVLGKDAVDKELLDLSRNARKRQGKSRPAEVEVPTKEIPVKALEVISETEAIIEQASLDDAEDEDMVVIEDTEHDAADDEKTAFPKEEDAEEAILLKETSVETETVVVEEAIAEEEIELIPVLAEADQDEVSTAELEEVDEDIKAPVPVPTPKQEPVAKAVESVVPDSDMAEKLESLVDELIATVPSEKESSTKNAEIESSTQPAADTNLVVSFKDLFSQSLTKIPLADMLSLGYSEAEVQSMEADALGLIASDGIRKPKGGVPSRWKIKSGEEEQVRILSKEEADQLISDELTKQTVREPNTRKVRGEARREPPRDEDTEQDSDRDADTGRRRRARDPRQAESRERPPRRSRKDTDEEMGESRRERPPRDGQRRRKRSDRGDGPRRIYNGRAPTKRKRNRDDPPSPNSPLWVDMDTFRDLLRSEAGLRLRILGDDWSDIVKEESDWRLDLYKKWLWTLHKGVGDPIVESRSDRMRRKGSGGSSRRDDNTQDQGPPPRRPRKRRERD